ncbi:glucosyl-3-phosphoglycerate synthase [Corynebacterium sp. H127]|uniref:glucosyl-3-phosphoglycerate synthase n=1 Tax=Corynebacterium sp. H127 TaxID=3133418 RepID=UPI0030B2F8E4
MRERFGVTLSRTSVIIPALNEEDTVARVVTLALADNPLEVIVIDSESTDDTARRAREAGARVVDWREAMPIHSTRPGKGEALWRGVHVARGDFVVFIDADLIEPRPHIVRDLIQPFRNPGVHLVKAHYRRPLHSSPTGGGRVTELTAKPLLRALFPELAQIRQPLSGEYALRTSVARTCYFAAGYGVEIGLLIDVYLAFGVAAIAQVDLGVRRHRNRPLAELAPMAEVVTRTVLDRVPGISTVARAQDRPPLATLS